MNKYTSKKIFENFKSVDRRFLSKYVFRKMKGKIPKYHISAVISFLFEDLIEELIKGNSITIGKLGKFFVKEIKPIKHFNFFTKEFEISEGSKRLRFNLHKKIKEILIKNLDIAKTYGDD